MYCNVYGRSTLKLNVSWLYNHLYYTLYLSIYIYIDILYIYLYIYIYINLVVSSYHGTISDNSTSCYVGILYT